MKEMECLWKENIRVDHERHENIIIKNWKQFALKIENGQQNKWKTNGSKQKSMFVRELLEIDWMK